jgi:ribosomal protein S18 acetylase RimI-like enzyme
VQFVESPVTDPTAHALLTEYFEYRASTFPAGRAYQPTFPAPPDFTPPRGVFLLLLDHDGTAIGCGGVRLLGVAQDGVTIFEVKHLWLKPHARGRGLGRRLLDELERRAAAFGARDLVLDTNRSLAAANALYRSAGYFEIDAYNDNPNATNWYAKVLPPRPGDPTVR